MGASRPQSLPSVENSNVSRDTTCLSVAVESLRKTDDARIAHGYLISGVLINSTPQKYLSEGTWSKSVSRSGARLGENMVQIESEVRTRVLVLSRSTTAQNVRVALNHAVELGVIQGIHESSEIRSLPTAADQGSAISHREVYRQ